MNSMTTDSTSPRPPGDKPGHEKPRPKGNGGASEPAGKSLLGPDGEEMTQEKLEAFVRKTREVGADAREALRKMFERFARLAEANPPRTAVTTFAVGLVLGFILAISFRRD